MQVLGIQNTNTLSEIIQQNITMYPSLKHENLYDKLWWGAEIWKPS